jgi:hypothetical protein
MTEKRRAPKRSRKRVTALCRACSRFVDRKAAAVLAGKTPPMSWTGCPAILSCFHYQEEP